MEEFVRKTKEALEGKTIVSAKVDGFGIELTLDDGNKFLYSAADGGYSSWDFFDRTDEYLEMNCIKNDDDLIKRQDAIDACLNGFCACVGDCVDEIEKLPSAQKTGKWREYNYPGQEHVYCSSCKEEYYVDDLLLGRNEYPNYCPNCGARMEV